MKSIIQSRRLPLQAMLIKQKGIVSMIFCDTVLAA